MTIGKKTTCAATIIAISAALLLSGCGNRDTLDDLTPAWTSSPLPEKKAAADVFDEFYIDDAPKAEAVAAASQPAEVAPAQPVPTVAHPPAEQPAPTVARPSTAQPVHTPPAQAPRGGGGAYSFNPAGRHVVQVAVTASQAEANELVNRLKNMGFPAYVAAVDNPTHDLTGQFFRVRVGNFESQQDARNFGESALVPAGFGYWIDRRSNDNVGVRLSAAPTTQAVQPAPTQAPVQVPAEAPAEAWPAVDFQENW